MQRKEPPFVAGTGSSYAAEPAMPNAPLATSSEEQLQAAWLADCRNHKSEIARCLFCVCLFRTPCHSLAACAVLSSLYSTF
jgi:hypothetical protein